MSTDRLIDAFEAARILGYHNLLERPAGGLRDAVNNRAYRLAYFRFQKARERGQIPKPDIAIGTNNGHRWWLHKLLAWAGHASVDTAPKRGRPKKKLDDRANDHQAANSQPAKASKASNSVPGGAPSVNANDEAANV